MPDRSLLPKWFPDGGILVLDDLMNEGSSDKNVLDLFTKDSHHQQITVIYLCQDLFPAGKLRDKLRVFVSRISPPLSVEENKPDTASSWHE